MIKCKIHNCFPTTERSVGKKRTLIWAGKLTYLETQNTMCSQNCLCDLKTASAEETWLLIFCKKVHKMKIKVFYAVAHKIIITWNIWLYSPRAIVARILEHYCYQNLAEKLRRQWAATEMARWLEHPHCKKQCIRGKSKWSKKKFSPKCAPVSTASPPTDFVEFSWGQLYSLKWKIKLFWHDQHFRKDGLSYDHCTLNPNVLIPPRVPVVV